MPLITRRTGLAGALLLAGLAPAPAAPPPATPLATQALLANLISNVDFLDRSSRFALDNSKNARLRAFARAEALEQSAAIDALWDWIQGRRPLDPKSLTATAQKLDTTPTGSTKPAWPAAPPPAKDEADQRLAKGQEDLDSLEGLTGPAFDADYKATQHEALTQVAADYTDYLAKGDDTALRALARRELPKIEKRLAGLARL